MIKPLPLTEFYRALHARGVRTQDLADALGVSGGAVRRLLAGLRRKGGLWRRLEALLTARERALLADVEQCSAWNNRRAAKKRPRWSGLHVITND
jgi:DNA-binding CsgD family transcriptional regulator